MTRSPQSSSGGLRLWLRRDFGEPPRYSLHFEVQQGLARLLPAPPDAPAEAASGARGGVVHGIDVQVLFGLQVLTALGPDGPWRGHPVLRAGGGLLERMLPGAWVEMATGDDQVAGPRRRREDQTLAVRVEDDPDGDGAPLRGDDTPTEVGLLAMPSLDDEELPPLKDDDPTDLSLLPPPMARLQALRRQRQLAQRD